VALDLSAQLTNWKNMPNSLDFEKPVAALDAEIAAIGADPARAAERAKAEAKRGRLLAEIYAKLTPWQKTQVARHPNRPRFLGITEQLFEDWVPLAGDRAFGDDVAILGGPARFRGRAVMLIGHEKGHDTASRVKRNFGMAKPEGYRKAARLMQMASRFGLPIVTLVDTSGAYPGIEAEERGQAEAIARSTEACLEADVPMVSVIIGEGGSGGAVALAAANKVLMLEHAVYAVISPEGCASILWRDGAKAAEAAVAMRISAQDLSALGVIDGIVKEPVGGAHRAPKDAIALLGDAIDAALDGLEVQTPAALKAGRRAKFLAFAQAA
jgi:acetyl-CoA carboxylase carboxyl transferase subunit alpha